MESNPISSGLIQVQFKVTVSIRRAPLFALPSLVSQTAGSVYEGGAGCSTASLPVSAGRTRSSILSAWSSSVTKAPGPNEERWCHLVLSGPGIGS